MAGIDLDEISRRPQRYWDVDGLPELVMGFLWMVWGGAWLLGERLPRGGTRTTFWTLVPALLALSGFAAVRLIKLLKARLTFPRTGYVEWREPGRGTNLSAAAVALVTAMILVALTVRGGATAAANAPLVLSVILSLAFLVASIRQRAPHLLALAAVAVALGLASGATDGGWSSANWMFVALGGAAAALGALRLALFVRRHPRLSSEGA